MARITSNMSRHPNTVVIENDYATAVTLTIVHVQTVTTQTTGYRNAAGHAAELSLFTSTSASFITKTTTQTTKATFTTEAIDGRAGR